MFFRVFISVLFFYFFFSPSFQEELFPKCPECMISTFKKIFENRKYFPENGDLSKLKQNMTIFYNQVKKIQNMFQRVISSNGSLLLIGSTGYKGSIGFPGYTGNSGKPGVRGIPGFRGSRGNIGLPGFTGSTGMPGIRGSPGNGPPGPQGIPGLNGSPGFPGIRGPRGPKGSTGSTGFPGSSAFSLDHLVRKTRSLMENKDKNFDYLCKSIELNQILEIVKKGFKNLDKKIDLILSSSDSLKKKFESLNFKQIENDYENLKRNQLNNFYQGDTGMIGAIGKSGKDGYTGITGIQGIPGPQGIPGLPGVQGFPGIRGSLGFPGQPGPGPQGFTGIPGYMGETGNTGPPGPPGFPGLQGFTGRSGNTGFTGSSGSCIWASELNAYSFNVEFAPGVNSLEECKNKCFKTRNFCKFGLIFNNSPTIYKCFIKNSNLVIRSRNLPYVYHFCKNF